MWTLDSYYNVYGAWSRAISQQNFNLSNIYMNTILDAQFLFGSIKIDLYYSLNGLKSII